MPDGDDVLDVEIPIEGESEKEMAVDLSDNVANHMLTQLMQTGTVAQNNFVTVQKVVDYDYLENKRMVTLDEAVGIREVASKTTPGGPSQAS
ncbi:hypothetical protein [Gimesia sp.]|uniref:hypothetical protein n=1 Tax=Gimesia sp. TaxID=2024833 RepID=UPI000C383EBC|nr:hypothetical protein [Gimesia sp.]MAX37592.1 hypothetical protein [Gimesia sp.]HAH47328.1 hypothetical protein [Planctomycetaceae bacterium]|tara:strand:+ start:380 stop:655 length:276 start_codon:yes stop_codon:yes gene_type:complete